MKNRTLKTLLTWMVLGLFVTNAAIAGEKYVLKGKVMDTDDNWLNDARVTLAPIGAVTYTDQNGEFTLEFTLNEPLKINKRKAIAALSVLRSGHITQTIRIRSMDYFSKETPIEVKLEPEPVDPNLTGFMVDMDPENSIVGKAKGKDAFFYVFVPESVKKVKAAFYISMHGIGNIKTPILQKFAEEEDLALVAMNGDPVKRGITSVTLLEEQIKKLAEMSGHPELATAPIMTFGHSNGTGFSASFPRDWPERTIAWVAFHPGFSGYLQFPNTEKVPAMVMCGTIDKYFLAARQDQVVATLRKECNAAMNIMMEADVGHSPADADSTWLFITDFLKAAMRIRLNEDGTLKPVEIEKGWLGATYNLEEGGRQVLDIAPYAEFNGDKSTASWLPDATFAEAWQLYGRNEPAKK
jgi:dienelactone hydrolase